MTTNVHKVNKRKWARWSPVARHVFNSLYEQMRDSPWAFIVNCNPKKVPPKRAWGVTCWNAAWVAADAVDEAAEAKAA